MSAVCAACGAPSSADSRACPNCGEVVATSSTERLSSASEGSRPQGALKENLAGSLAYMTVLPAVCFLFLKPYSRNEFIRFHALQSIAIAIGTMILAMLLLLLGIFSSINLLLIPISFIIALGIALVFLVCIIKAYRHEAYKLPFLGAWAEKLAVRI